MTDNHTVSQDSESVESPQHSVEAESLARIKEILFGDRVTQIMQQINQLDAHLSQQLSNLEQRMDAQLDLMNQQFTEKIDLVRQQSIQELNQLRQQNTHDLAELRQQNQHELTVIKQDIATAYSNQDALGQTMDQALQERSAQLEQTIHDRAAQVKADCLEKNTALHQALEHQQNTHNALKSKLSASLLQLSQEI